MLGGALGSTENGAEKITTWVSNVMLVSGDPSGNYLGILFGSFGVLWGSFGVPRGSLGVPFGPPGSLGGPLESLLGSLWRSLGHSRRFPEHFRVALGVIGGLPGWSGRSF